MQKKVYARTYKRYKLGHEKSTHEKEQTNFNFLSNTFFKKFGVFFLKKWLDSNYFVNPKVNA